MSRKILRYIGPSFALFLLALSASAQTPNTTPAHNQPPQHADIADQRACYQQARTYVTDANKGHVNEPDYFYFNQAHYDPTSKTCYVQYTHFENKVDSMFYMIFVGDAFEGRVIAEFIGTQERQPDGSWQEKLSSDCQVNGESCKERAVFNRMLWKLIPAFRPVTAKDVN